MTRLSASRIKTLLDCSWRYWAQYGLKINSEGNPGSLRGSTTHDVLECLLRPDRKRYVNLINRTGDAFCDPVLERFITKKANFYEVGDPENLEMIKGYIVLAVKADFYCEGSIKVEAEVMFEEKNDKFWIISYLDKVAEYTDKVVIKDYKTQKSKFTAKELEFSIQGLTYLLAAKIKYPNKDAVLEFLQLQDTKSRDKSNPFPIQKVTATDEILEGFKEYLTHISNYVKDFDREKATSNFAKSDFAKSRMCCGGQLGELKADGKPKFICSFKYPNIYFALSENGKVLTANPKKSDLEKIQKPGQIIEEKIYEGCPAWKFLWEKKKV